ncbi:Metabotropic glutamate receptor-like protein [Seminavis robusta]|uniref:Metabotropic glutamate receptor-like protein n=1 Tax=Seminavis robusta TaxID=568900 RepID=A0A9N8HHY6_9STRA|nr:Metabotropic glutamate receptor-like protein [Seminavis robusta]|eukprot:Sro591_g171990.1 Metabotropic glutamate receptor-like protein (1230) ;mRNA; f:16247-20181
MSSSSVASASVSSRNATSPTSTPSSSSSATSSTSVDAETAHFLHLYQDLTSNVFDDSTDSGKPIILSSLHRLDELLHDTNASARERLMPGVNADTVATIPEGKQFLRCHLAALLDFSHGDNVPYKHAFEAAAAIALAVHHLNEGVGWIVPEVTGLHQRCPIRFTAEFADTEYDQGVALKHVIDMTDRDKHKPCAFIGAPSSDISIPTAIVTSIRGYPQISSQSTSEQLDDNAQFPLFGRTVPSDVDNAVPIVKWFRDKLGATHLAVVHVNNGYGNAFADDLKLAAQAHAPDLKIEKLELSEHPNQELIQDTIRNIERTKFSYIFAALNDAVIDSVMLEAYRQGVAGNGIHNWFFSNTFGDIDDRFFEPGSPLHLAYRGVGRLQVSGGHQGMRSFDTFACNLRTLRSSPPDLDYLASLLPQKEYMQKNTEEYITLDTVTANNGLNMQRHSHRMPYIYEDDFMDPVPKMADRTSPAYEAAIALGLSACDVVANGLPLTGKHHFEQFTKTEFMGVESQVKFAHETGTRDPDTTLFAVENEVEEMVRMNVKVDANGTTEWRELVQFHAVVTDVYSHGEWEHLEDYVFSDLSTNIQSDLTPPPPVEHHYVDTPLKIVAGFMFAFILLLAIRCAWWTEKNKTTRVVRASQPLFLRVIIAGIVIFASAIIPMNIDDRIASHEGCTIACNFFYWLMFLGFSIMFSGLFTKIYRVNQILNNPVKFRRVKVTVRDVIKPMAAIIGVNLILLIVMTSVAPSEWEIVVAETDQHGRPTETYGHCTTKHQIPYYTTLGIVNFSALVFSIQQAYNTRKLATEFSESRYIFYAMIGILVALFQGIPVLILVRDSPTVQNFIKCTVIFVTCCSVLLFMFVPKMKYLVKISKKTRSQRMDLSVKVSGLQMDASNSNTHNQSADHLNGSANFSKLRQKYENGNGGIAISGLSNLSGLSGASSASGDGSSEEEGVRFTTMTHTELKEENDKLRKKLKILNCDVGTLGTTSSVSEDSAAGSSGMRIIARKSPGELMAENKKLKKTLKKAVKNHVVRSAAARATINEADNESQSEGDGFAHETYPDKQVSFKLPSLRKMPNGDDSMVINHGKSNDKGNNDNVDGFIGDIESGADPKLAVDAAMDIVADAAGVVEEFDDEDDDDDDYASMDVSHGENATDSTKESSTEEKNETVPANIEEVKEGKSIFEVFNTRRKDREASPPPPQRAPSSTELHFSATDRANIEDPASVL